MNEANLDTVPGPGGRRLEITWSGEGFPLLFHNGTPAVGSVPPALLAAAARHALRIVSYSRPGYRGSSRHPGRRIADAAADVAAVLDAVGAREFVSLGWSGGGPHSLACAALLPERCLAATSLAGVAPADALGLDFLAGMGPENVEEFSLARRGEAALRPWLEEQARELVNLQPEEVAAAFGGLVSPVDQAAIRGEFAVWLAASSRGAVSQGVDGWLDDDLAFAREWGFDLQAIRRPVAVWQGGEDRMVPAAHGAWLAGHVPQAAVHLYPAEGHLSLAVGQMGMIVDQLMELAGRK